MRELRGSLDCVVAAPGDAAPRAGLLDNMRVVRGGQPLIRGALGDFEVLLVAAGSNQALGALLTPPIERFDLVVDLGTPPLLHQAMLPLGYYAPGAYDSARTELLSTLPAMRGEFEKPKYLNYNPEICAHGRSGKRGCTACLNVCPAEAIVSIGGTATIASVLALTAALSVVGCNGKSEDAAKTAATAVDATAAPKTPLDHPPARPVGEVDLAGIAKADGGKTVFEVFNEKAALANQKVVVRGKVVKTNAGIMNKDWVHVRDGSGTDGTNDLTVTTTMNPLPSLGDTVLVTGTAVTNKDFGMGYQYPVLVEEAEVKIEIAAAK